MKEVARPLEKGRRTESIPPGRAKAYLAARQKSREILVRIQVEEEILLRRLRIAELARQVQQLIEHQTKVRQETDAVSGEPADRRNEMNLAALEDQRDVTASFGQFEVGPAAYADASRPDAGREAAEALADSGQTGDRRPAEEGRNGSSPG